MAKIVRKEIQEIVRKFFDNSTCMKGRRVNQKEYRNYLHVYERL